MQSIPYVPHENFVRRCDTKVGRDNIFKLTIRNEFLHEISNDNGDGVANIATLEPNLFEIKSLHIKLCVACLFLTVSL
jgi:hypothetical protein